MLLICEVGHIDIYQICRRQKSRGRLGGDEFAVLQLESTGHPKEQFVKRLQAKIDLHNRTASRRYAINVSIGMVHVESGSTISLEELMAQADTEMYRVKHLRSAQRKSRN